MHKLRIAYTSPEFMTNAFRLADTTITYKAYLAASLQAAQLIRRDIYSSRSSLIALPGQYQLQRLPHL